MEPAGLVRRTTENPGQARRIGHPLEIHTHSPESIRGRLKLRSISERPVSQAGRTQSGGFAAHEHEVGPVMSWASAHDLLAEPANECGGASVAPKGPGGTGGVQVWEVEPRTVPFAAQLEFTRDEWSGALKGCRNPDSRPLCVWKLQAIPLDEGVKFHQHAGSCSTSRWDGGRLRLRVQ